MHTHTIPRGICQRRLEKLKMMKDVNGGFNKFKDMQKEENGEKGLMIELNGAGVRESSVMQ